MATINRRLRRRKHASRAMIQSDLSADGTAALSPRRTPPAPRPRRVCGEQQINLLYPSHRHPSTIVRTYLSFCQKHIAEVLAAASSSTRAGPNAI
jgi:hypothetical protein